jgi:hypothetical protein
MVKIEEYRKQYEIMDTIAAKLTPEEWKWFQEIPETLRTFDLLITLNQRLIRWARQDPSKRGAIDENLYSLVGEIEQLIGS